MVAVSKRYCARAITGNRCAVVEAVSSSVVLGVLGNRADSACVKTDDLNSAAVCKGVFSSRCSVGADSDRGGVTRYIVCDDGICTRVSACDVEREIEPLVLVTLITCDSLTEIKVVLSKAVNVARALIVRVGGVFAVDTYGCSRVAKDIAVGMENIVLVSCDEYVQITGGVRVIGYAGQIAACLRDLVSVYAGLCERSVG